MDNNSSENCRTGITQAKKEKIGIGAAGCSGCLFSLIGLSMGIFLCLTGVGAILGIPIILGALLFPFIAPALGFMTHITGKCPYCGQGFSDQKGPGFDCPACKERIIVRGEKLYTKEALKRKNEIK